MNKAQRKVLFIIGAIVAAAVVPFLLVQRRSSAHPGNGLARAQAGSPASGATLQTWRNLGKAYYEQGKYTQAADEFQKVVKSGHAVATDYMNLGLAYTQANDLNPALAALTTAKQMAPKMIAIDYNLGILYKRELHYGPAEEEFKKVIAADPEDPASWFNLGTVYFAEHKLELALQAHEHLNKMGFERGQNFYVASLFRTFTILVRLGRRPEAQKMLQLHQKYSDLVPSISLQSPALEKGKYGAVLIPATAPVRVAGGAAMRPVSFRDIRSELGVTLHGAQVAEDSVEVRSADYSLAFARRKLLPLLGTSIAIGDYDGDNHPDFCVVNPAGRNQLFHNSGTGTFQDVTAKAGVEGTEDSVSATFADYDNSGNLSLFVVGLGGVHLYKNNGNGTFTDVTQKAGFKADPGEIDTRALLFDADNDGLLDLVVTGYTNLNTPPHGASFRFPDDFPPNRIHFYRNNGNGTFTDITDSTGLGAVRGRFRNVLFADFNGDGYPDLVFLRDDGPPLYFENLGGDKFADRTREAGPAFSKATAVDGAVADFDHDGRFDLALFTTSGYEILRNNGDAKFTPVPDLPAIKPPTGLLAFRGLAADINGNSFVDLLVADSSGNLRLLANRLGHFHAESIHLPVVPSEKIASLSTAWLGHPGVLDLIGTTRNGRLDAWAKTGPPEHWLEVRMEGSKSNKAGVGSEIELKQGNFYDKVMITGGPAYVYTGNLAKLDVVRATWPTQIVENDLNVATNAPIRFRESERLASSCPMLYIWNGKQFVYVTDILGVGPLGELAPDGTRIKPYSREFVRLPQTMQERNGSYEFQMTDELREVDYFDRLRLIAVDHPATEKIYANEIYSSTPSAPALYATSSEHLPVSAVDDHGDNVLPLISKADHSYPHNFQHLRIPGMAKLHSLTLNLGQMKDARRVSLWLTGWVFWTDSNGSRALMHNPALPMISPYLQVRNQKGKWVTVIPDMGLPSGTNRTIRVDLTGKFLSTDHHVRIVTNLCVYWDHIFFTTNDRLVHPGPEIAPEYADLHFRGFSTPVSDPSHIRPDYYEYTALMGHAPWNPMRGLYTRYGNVEALVGKADSRLVVMSTGDEMTVRFSAASLPPLGQGWVRSFFLDASGYAKDGEPNTADFATVAPLPFRSMSNYPPPAEEPVPTGPAYRDYLRKYQTRPSYQLVPSLAPPVK